MTGSAIRDQQPKVCFPFIGDDLGGSHISAIKLVKGLLRDGFGVVVVIKRADGPLADYLRRENVAFEVLRLPDPARSTAASLSRMARALPEVVAYIRRNGFDLVHTNDGWTHLLWGVAARIAGAKLIWHHRGDPDARATNFVGPLLAHRLLAVSRFALPRKPILPMAARSRVIHSPFDIPNAQSDRRGAHDMLTTELGVAPETQILAYFGGLIERKRPLLFVDIVHRVLQESAGRPVVGCLFGVASPGGRDFAAECAERARALGIANAVRLMGFRTPVEPYMTACDILLIPAVGEPFGRTLIEAMMLGTPVIATAHGGNPEAIVHGVNGLLVEPESAEAFVAPIRALLDDEGEHQRIARTARIMALQRYGAERHIRSVQAVYREILPYMRPAATSADAVKSL
jgi:glycosyltransferase involved in cell wall biosynthesis